MFHYARPTTQKLTNGFFALLFLATQLVLPIMSAQAVGAAGNPSADLDQCRNGTLSNPAQCLDLGGNVGWVNGNAGASNAHWREGDSLAYRLRFDNLTVGSHTVTIEWDTTKGGTHALDYLTTFNRTETTADPCSGVPGCSNPTTFAIPDDPNSSVTQVPGVFTLYNGTITSLSAYTVAGSYAGDSATRITITFNAATATPVLAWAGHIASQIDWGTGNSASAISGSPYHTRLVALDGTGGNQDRSLAAAAVFPTPTITTQASAAALNVGQSITDIATISGPNTPLKGTVLFYVCGPALANPTCTSGGTQVGTAVTVTPGTGTTGTATSAAYSPPSPGNYCFRAEFTPAADSPYSPQNHTNLTSECFTVNLAPGSITIIKDARPNNAQDFRFTTTGGLGEFDLDDDSNATLPNSRTFANLTPGSYSFTEAAVAGWDFSAIDCGNATGVSTSGSTVTINLSAGQNVTCTYVNLKRGTITVNKVTVPANDPTGFEVTASGSGTIAGNATRTISSGQPTTYDVAQGTYSINETVPEGWAQTSNDCAGLVINATNLSRSCTITNTKLAKLTIIKDATPNDAQDFAFVSNDVGLTNFSLDDDSDPTLTNSRLFANLTAGTYSITEQAVSGWQLTNLICSGATSFSRPNNGSMLQVTLAPGEEATCTFTNTKLGSIGGVKFNDLNANGIYDLDEPTLSGWTIILTYGNTETQLITDDTGSYLFIDLLPGDYSLAEMLQTGWTQTLAAAPVSLEAGQNSVNNNFGNFANGTISGVKFNDLNGNSVQETSEPLLPNWIINLTKDGQAFGSPVTTDANGSYSFNNLPPGTYNICEVQQAGWTQTLPLENQCYTITIDRSGETNTNIDFGNQGRGTIQVIKNVDTDGDGDIDQTGATDWDWNIDGQGPYTTGTAVGVAAGSYSVSEIQKTDYHVTAVSCSGEQTPTVPTTMLNVRVSPGESVICTFTNTRDTATIQVNKALLPASDTGRFNLLIDSTLYATAVGDDGTTGDIRVLTGTHSVSETASGETDLQDYLSSFNCNNGLSGNDVDSGNFTISRDESVICTFTNTRKASLTIIKDANPNDAQDFEFVISNEPPAENPFVQPNPINILDPAFYETFALDDDDDDAVLQSFQTFSQLDPGTYYITESELEGWDLTGVECSEGIQFSEQTGTLVVTIAPGEDVICTFENTKRGSITIVKDAQPDSVQAFSFTGNLTTADKPNFTLTDDGVNTELASRTFTNLEPGTYNATEPAVKGWSLESISCTGTDEQNINTNERNVVVSLEPGENVVCTFVNQAVPPELTVIKNVINDSGGNQLASDFTMIVDGTNVSDNEFPGNESGTTVTLDPGDYAVSENGLPGYTATFSEDCIGTLELGDAATCTITNDDNPPLLAITKSNDQPVPTTVGDTVTYTLVVTVPEESGVVYDATVTDLPPENFTYLNDSWTADSSVEAHDVTSDVASSPTGEPTYGSPGDWYLGTLLPGEVITLTYRALIQPVVSPGDYPDIAFVRGFSNDSDQSATVLGNIYFSETPFVGTQVSVLQPLSNSSFTAGQVLGASTLVNTGTKLGAQQFVIPAGLILLTLFINRATSKRSLKKGATK